MAFKSYNGDKGSREGRGEFSLVPRTLGERETKLFDNAQRAAVGSSRSVSPRRRWSYRDASIRHMEAEMEEMRQVLVVNNLKMPAHMVGESSSELMEFGREAAPQGSSKGKWALSHYDEVESHGDRRTVASSRHKDTSSQADSNEDLLDSLNSKWSREERDMRKKLVVKVTTAARSIISARLVKRIGFPNGSIIFFPDLKVK